MSAILKLCRISVAVGRAAFAPTMGWTAGGLLLIYYCHLIFSGSLSVQGDFVFWFEANEVFSVPEMILSNPWLQGFIAWYLLYFAVRLGLKAVSTVRAPRLVRAAFLAKDTLDAAQWAAGRTFSVALPVPADRLKGLLDHCRKYGFRLRGGEGRYCGFRWQRIDLTGLILRCGLFLVLLGLMTSILLRQAFVVNVGEQAPAEPFSRNDNPYAWRQNESPDTSEVPTDLTVRLDRLSLRTAARQLDGQTLESQAQAHVEISSTGRPCALVIRSFPPTSYLGYDLHLLAVGVAPNIAVRNIQGFFPQQIPDFTSDTFPMLSVFRFNDPVTFEVPGLPYRFTLELVAPPDPTMSHIDRLKAASCRLEIAQGQKVLFHDLIPQRKLIIFGDYDFMIREIRVWATISAVLDPGIAIGKIGLLLIALGLGVSIALLFTTGRQDLFLVAQPHPDGLKIILAGESARMSWWFGRRFRRLLSAG